MKYKTVPTTVDAHRFGPGSIPPPWLEQEIDSGRVTLVGGENYVDTRAAPFLAVETSGGVVPVKFGDWIIRSADGVIRPCSGDEFPKLYEPA